VLQELIEAEAAEVIGAARYERTDSRVKQRNGSRPRTLSRRPVTSICASRSWARVRSSR
jgi:transposase-like protein